MRKGGLSIEGYIYSVLSRGLHIGGRVYLNGTRPFDSKKEDAVVSFLSGRKDASGLAQSGVVNVNIYVPNLGVASPYLVKNVARCEEVETEVLSILHSHQTGDYLLSVEDDPTTFQDGELFHVVNVRVKYKYNIVTTNE